MGRRIRKLVHFVVKGEVIGMTLAFRGNSFHMVQINVVEMCCGRYTLTDPIHLASPPMVVQKRGTHRDNFRVRPQHHLH